MGILNKIFKFIDKHCEIAKDKYNNPSVVKFNGGYSFSLVLVPTRNALVCHIKRFLIKELGVDDRCAETISTKYVENQYKIFSDYIIKHQN